MSLESIFTRVASRQGPFQVSPVNSTTGSWEVGKGKAYYDFHNVLEVYAYGSSVLGSCWGSWSKASADGTDVFVSSAVPKYFYCHFTPRPIHDYMNSKPEEWVPMGLVRYNATDGSWVRPDDFHVWGNGGRKLRRDGKGSGKALPLEGKSRDELYAFVQAFGEENLFREAEGKGLLRQSESSSGFAKGHKKGKQSDGGKSGKHAGGELEAYGGDKGGKSKGKHEASGKHTNRYFVFGARFPCGHLFSAAQTSRVPDCCRAFNFAVASAMHCAFNEATTSAFWCGIGSPGGSRRVARARRAKPHFLRSVPQIRLMTDVKRTASAT